ncbi:hypothetical protein [Clostridium sp.]|uniref:hypothetical protein n=1 Tax=Clostridium sp. TaxID=1506 RepID=UPI0028FFD398|nr:hypothetical protein [Clostridium sp.]MDU1181345.1 hypothetical protein [Clostridium sp.]
MNFNEWLKNEESIISRDYFERDYFEALLDTLPPYGKRKVKSYYIEKYRYYIKTHPQEKYEQIELNINERAYPLIK